MKANLIPIGATETISIKKINEHHYSSPFHFHKICELNHVVSSCGKRIVGDNIDNFSDGDLVLMSPDLPHIWYNDPVILNNPPKTKLAKAVVVYFPINFLDKLTSDNLALIKTKKMMEKANRGLRFYGTTQKFVSKKLSTIAEKNGFERIIAFLEIIEALTESREYEQLASVGYAHNFNERDTERMTRVFKYLMQHFADPISLQEIADVANMTPPAFSTYFRKRTQKCFTTFLNEIRVGHACKLLEDPDLAILDICFSSGFQNATHFNKMFKQFIGRAPSEYRKFVVS
ncbi:AraC family transcriptional regulator [Dinghuibacter silviterrae]|uniref:Helix-turn-helix protein n=1 Tax=Dinghuibacter silviterrae TaxID=1539049 RepID=A0A4R8DES4_9BACT|nr:AraC family transcriptional regulator [Dinghuibacter silviterrae]TDW95897.1 helix-turn-helix protein [Dinghuibacter silviterrae]